MFYSFDYRGATIHTANDRQGERVSYQLADYKVRAARSVHAAKCQITRAMRALGTEAATGRTSD